MKLSFSTKGWGDYSWQDFCRMAKEYGFQGIELHELRDGDPRRYQGKGVKKAARQSLTINR